MSEISSKTPPPEADKPEKQQSAVDTANAPAVDETPKANTQPQMEEKETGTSGTKGEQKAAAPEHNEESLLERSLIEQLTAIDRAIEDGTINNITKKLKSIQTKLEKLGEKAAKKHEQDVKRIKSKLSELKDWQSYATIPKKQELCQKMEKLVGAELPEPDLANAIRELQQEWKSIKGGGSDEEQKLWEVFRDAADKAFQPCKEHFEKLKEKRSKNLEQRKRICVELESFHEKNNWNDGIDWKAIEKIIEAARKEFHDYSPVDHKHLEKIKDRFNTAYNNIAEKLRPEFERNENLKRKLVKQVEGLLDNEDIFAAIESTKQAQKKWKEVGITRRREDQKLWRKFHNACDKVFSKRDAERKQEKENINQIIQQAESICLKIEEIQKLDDQELQKSRQQFMDLKKQFRDINGLDKTRQKKIFKRFSQSCDRYEKQYKGIKGRKNLASQAAALKLAALCDLLETGSDLQEVQQQCDSITIDDHELRKILEQRYSSAQEINQGKKQTDLAKNEEALRLILIQLEILLDKPSPEEDKALRMKYQLNQLSDKGMAGKSTENVQVRKKELIQEWLSSPSAEKPTQEILTKRLAKLLE